jgi:hypothetical protein
VAGALLAWVLLAGCATNRESHTPRTPEEQMLLSKASDISISKVDLAKATGHTVFLDATSLECVDKVYVLDALRQALATSGATVLDKEDAADTIIVVRSGMLGTQSGTNLFGMPALKLPSPMTAGTFETPELALFKRAQQDGFAKLCLSAYNRESKDLLFSGEGVARTRYSRWTVLVFFHFATTNVPELKVPVSRVPRR